MKQPELSSEGSIDIDIARLLKNWTVAVSPPQHHHQLLLQQAGLLRAARRPRLSLRDLLRASLETLIFVPVDITDQPVMYSDPEFYYSLRNAYRGDHRYFGLRLASQHMLNMGIGLSRFATG